MAGFFFTENIDPAAPVTPGTIDRKRRIAEALMKQGMDGSPVQHWTQGVGRMAQAFMGGRKERELDAQEAAGAKSGNEGMNALVAALTGGGGGATGAAPTDIRPLAQGGPASSSPNVPDDLKSGIASTAQALGISPVDLATAISYETAGTFDPTKSGPTTQWGQHRGLIQFGEPQAQKYGVDWNNPVGSQLGPEGAVAKYLKDTGVKPGMGMMDIYSAINAGGVGRYGASDANNGGAPGTVADKVNQQMAGHRAKALAMFPEGAEAFAGAQSAAPAQQAIAGAMPNAAQRPGQPPVAPMPNAGAGAAPPVAPMPNAGGSNARLMAALTGVVNNPWISDSQKSMAMMLAKDSMGPQFDFVQGQDGTFYRKNTRAGTLEPVTGINAGGKAPTVQVIKQPDGSEVAVQWDNKAQQWQPMNAPSGGNAVSSKLEAEAKARERIVQQQGGDPKTPQNQAFILSGRMPREDQQPLTASDKKAVLEADEAVMMNENTVNMLNKAKELSKTALANPTAPYVAPIGAMLGNQTAKDTVELNNLTTAQALESLKATFGGAPTEGERKILLDIQGSIGQPDDVRQKIFDRAIAAAKRRLEFNKQRATDLRGGNYYKPADKGGPQSPGQMSTPQAPQGDLKSKYGLE